MAPKKSLPLPPPPTEPEEEEEETEEEEEEEEDEEELDDEGDEEPDVKKNEIATPDKNSFQVSKNRKEEVEEEEEDEDEEEPDSPPSPNVSDFTVEPISQKKRPSSSLSTQKDDEKASKNSKRIKSCKGEENKDNGSAASGAGRVWSLDDQIALLQGMIDYQNKNGSDPFSDKDAFHKFIKKKLQAEISKNQMYDKARRLKKKYEEKAESDDLAFPRPYDLKLFDLSKKIWGKVEGKKDRKIGSTNGNVKESKKDDLVMDDASDDDDDDLDRDDNSEEVDLARGDMIDAEGDFQSNYPNLVQSFDLDAPSHFPASVISFVKEGLGAIGSVKARELEEKWKKIRMQEAELYVQKLELMKKLMKEYIQLGKNGKNVK